MPTYEYVCTECGSPLEVVQSIHEPSLTECPSCGGRLRKVFGNVGVVFKGSGFYRTDNRSKSAKSGSGSSGGSASKESSGSTSSGSGEGTSSTAKSDGSKPAGAKTAGSSSSSGASKSSSSAS